MENNGAADATSPSNTDAGSGGPGEEAQAVKVAVHIRPLIGGEIFQGCKDCVSLVSGEPQVQIGSHSFTFDHVYGSTGSPSCAIFEECVSPLVEGLFQGYNATVLAYGQTGSGKTYTMGTGYTVGGSTEGVIPKAMELIFRKIAVLKKKAEFQIRVSFIEILKEEVHDLLDPNPPIAIKSDNSNCFGSKTGAPGKPPIQIRENTNGEITLAGVTEIDVGSLEEMASCLEQGSLCRATASTNMNSRSSRSHAIFTITLEQKRISDLPAKSNNNCTDDVSDDFLCAKLHLVDLAGSERAKRTGADGVRFKEGVHINKGLLALGNVISALGDDKKRKEGGHVPYRDSKLTRLLQDSLGGNSRTVMIACISPADSNAEETLNTLKYANRARNIQNKPVVNRDPMAAEMQRMRQQVELLQAELLCIRTGGSFEEIQILKQRTAWLETSLLELQQELQIARDNLHLGAQHLLETQVERDKLQLKLDMLRSGKTWEDVDDGGASQGAGLLESYAERIKMLENEVQQLRNACPQTLVFQQQQHQSRTSSVLDTDLSILSLPEGVEATEMEEETVAKEMEHARLQDSLDKELEELNKKLEQKEAEMKTFAKCDGVVLKQHFERKIVELEEEKKVLQSERDTLMAELTSLTNTSDEQSQKRQETYIQKVKALEAQISELKKKQENQTQLLKQKQRSDEAAKRLQDEIQRIKTQKVQLQHKIKQESEQFRLWKALREKEVLQLKKEGRRNEYEMHKLQALNQRQKMVLQRKTEEAAMAMRRLKDLLEARKPSSKENSVPGASAANGSGGQANEKSLQQWLDHELEVAVHIHEVRNNYEKQTDSRAALAKELAKLKQEQDTQEKQPDIFRSRTTSMSPGARQAKIALLESMLNASSSTLVAMASQLSEAEERERAFSGRARWQHLRSMGDAKNLLQYNFSSAVDARCKFWDKELENKELKEKISELTMLLKQSEAHRQERDRQQFAKEHYIAKLLTSAMKAGTTNIAIKSCFDEISKHMLQLDDTGPRHLEYPDDRSDVSAGGNSSLPFNLRKASRDPLSNHSTDPDASDVSEGEESDMDIDDDIDDDDASDEDWSEVGEKRPSRSRTRKIKGDKSLNGLQDLAPTQGEIVEAKAKSRPDSPLCCSCSRASGCKTSKCACKAAGSLCGLNCGCSSKKCANRESGLEEGEAAEVAEAIETLKLDKEIRNVQRTQVECDQTVADAFIKKEDVQRAELVLAKHGAAVLENVWTDELETVGLAAKSGLTVDGNFHPDKRNFRRPLSDIGNNAQAEEVDEQPKMKQRKRWGKALVQLVPTTATAQHPTSETAGAGGPRQPHTGRQHDIQPAENAIETGAVGLDIPAAFHHAVPRNDTGRLVPCTTEAEGLPQSQYSVGLQRDGPLPVKLQRNARKKSSPPSSPLRARNIHAAAAAAAEEGSGLSKRLANSGSSASPRAPGKGVVREKENV